MLDTTTCVRSSRRLAAMAQLSASLPQLQKVISLVSAWMSVATEFLAFVTASRHGAP